MTVLMVDAENQFRAEYGDVLAEDLPVHTLLYADDTLLIDISGQYLEKFMLIVADLGKEYGLELNWKKVESLPVRCEAHIHDPDGNELKAEESIKYLGALLTSDGRINSELSRQFRADIADSRMI